MSCGEDCPYDGAYKALTASVQPKRNGIGPVFQLMKMKKKGDAGAQFFQTQTVCGLGLFQSFMEKIHQYDIPVQVGVVILKPPRMGQFMNKNVSGITVPRPGSMRSAR